MQESQPETLERETRRQNLMLTVQVHKFCVKYCL